MALDAYSPCPCGSGKKFKWCCQPIHIQMDKAFRQEADGQHEMALRLMDEIMAEHPSNPEVCGRKAELLYQNGRFDEGVGQEAIAPGKRRSLGLKQCSHEEGMASELHGSDIAIGVASRHPPTGSGQ